MVKMTTFSTEYKKWSCYTSFWSLELTDHFDTNLDSYKYSHWSLEGKIKILRIFADDVMGTKFDEKYFQCILSEYLTNFWVIYAWKRNSGGILKTGLDRTRFWFWWFLIQSILILTRFSRKWRSEARYYSSTSRCNKLFWFS